MTWGEGTPEQTWKSCSRGYVFVTAPISPTPDLREDVAARVGETGHRMLLVYRVEGCFREAVEALKRSV
jgi:hypothetical protein